MKKTLAILMVLTLCVSTAFAAEWGEGLSAAQPYAGVPAVDLGATMGYIILFPRAKIPASVFCDELDIYLPREDVAKGQGTLTLYVDPGEGDPQPVETISFADSNAVGIRPLNESELANLSWGGGVCVYARLAKSLGFDVNYFVTMDEGCFTASGGTVSSIAVPHNPDPAVPDAWVPVLSSDYGVSGLFYAAPVETPEEAPQEEAAEEAAEEEAPAAEEAPAEEEEAPQLVPKLDPEVGDIFCFDLRLGGDAKSAVLFTENDSVMFDAIEFTQSGPVTGSVTGEDLNWGIVFLNENGDPVEVVRLSN